MPAANQINTSILMKQTAHPVIFRSSAAVAHLVEHDLAHAKVGVTGSSPVCCSKYYYENSN